MPYSTGKTRNRCIQIYSFGERILLEHHTRDVGLSDSTARSMKLI